MTTGATCTAKGRCCAATNPLFFLLIAGEELLVPGRFDCEAITAERPHVDRGALDPEEGSRCVTLPWLGLARDQARPLR